MKIVLNYQAVLSIKTKISSGKGSLYKEFGFIRLFMLQIKTFSCKSRLLFRYYSSITPTIKIHETPVHASKLNFRSRLIPDVALYLKEASYKIKFVEIFFTKSKKRFSKTIFSEVYQFISLFYLIRVLKTSYIVRGYRHLRLATTKSGAISHARKCVWLGWSQRVHPWKSVEGVSWLSWSNTVRISILRISETFWTFNSQTHVTDRQNFQFYLIV